MPTPTAHLLVPYTTPPPAQSLHLVTSVLGSTSNWLVLRCLCDALPSSIPRGNNPDHDAGGEEWGNKQSKRAKRRKVVLVSFLRGWEFWRAEARRIGLDLNRLSKDGSFTFLDGLSELFSHERSGSIATSSTPSSTLPHRPVPSSVRPSPGSVRGRSHPTINRPAPSAASVPQKATSDDAGSKKLRWSNKPGGGGLEAIERLIISTIEDMNRSRTMSDGSDESLESDTLLVLDQPDLLLAATGPNMGMGSMEVSEMMMGLRQHVHSTIVTLAADSPLIHNSHQPTPLETEHAGLVVALAHQAQMVMQLRGLDTGVARDVSGVLRVSKGGAWASETELENGEERHEGWEEKEMLYFVQADGAVRVFGRGE